MMAIKTTISALALATGTVCATGAAMAEDVTLRYSNWLPTGHLLESVFNDYFAAVTEATEGRVTFETFPKVVGSVPAQLDVVADGQADVAFFVTAYKPDRFLMARAFELPFVCNDLSSKVKTLNAYYPESFGSFGEFGDDVHVLSLFSTSEAQLFTSGAPLATMDDLKGLKIRTGGGTMVRTAELLDIVPVAKPVSELYEIMSAGIADGAMTPAEVIKSFGLVDLTKRAVLVEGGVASGAILSLIVNQDKFDMISAEDQAKMNELGGDALAQATVAKYAAADQASYDAMLAAGGTVEDASPELVAELKVALEPIAVAWMEEAKAAGLEDPAAAIDEIRAMCQQ